MANLVVVVDKNDDSMLCGRVGWGGRSLYVAEHYMGELSAGQRLAGLGPAK